MDVSDRHCRFKRFLVLILILAAAIILVAILLPRNPIAVIEVVDVRGKPIPGATVKPYALRPKPAGGQSGHYLWTKDRYDISPEPVVTNETGTVNVPYPTFVVERVETGKITVSIKHPEYISDTQDIVVSTSPPRGAPWRVRMNFIIDRLDGGAVVTRTNPLVLKRGELLILKPAETLESVTELYAQTSSEGWHDNDFWDRSQPGVVVSRKHSLGVHAVRLIGLNEDNELMFSETLDVTIKQGVTNSVSLALKPARTVRGKLSDNVPRPVVNGRVVVNIVPAGRTFRDPILRWHTWTGVNDDDSFEMPSLPAGDLEVIALCDGFISVDGSGQRQSSVIRYPQKHTIGANDLDIVIDMEPTARLEVTVFDDNGRLLEGARVSTWPNVCWHNCGSTIFCSSLYKSVDRLRQLHEDQDDFQRDIPSGFFGISDVNGVAVLSNVPARQTSFAVEHKDYVLPKFGIGGTAARRQASMVLEPGAVTRTTVVLEPRDKDPQRHY